MNPEEFIQGNVRLLSDADHRFALYMYDEIYDDLFGDDDDPTVITQKSYVIQNIIDQIRPEPTGDVFFSMQHHGRFTTVHFKWVAIIPQDSKRPWIVIMPTTEQIVDNLDES